MTWRVMPVMPVVPPCCGQIHQISDWKHMRWSWSFPFSFKLRSPLPWIFEMSWNVLNPDRIHVLQMQSPLHSRTRCKDPLHLLSTCWMKNDGMDCVCFFFFPSYFFLLLQQGHLFCWCVFILLINFWPFRTAGCSFVWPDKGRQISYMREPQSKHEES